MTEKTKRESFGQVENPYVTEKTKRESFGQVESPYVTEKTKQGNVRSSGEPLSDLKNKKDPKLHENHGNLRPFF